MKRTTPKNIKFGQKAELLQNRHRACKKYGKRTHFFHHILGMIRGHSYRMVRDLLQCTKRPERRKHPGLLPPLSRGDEEWGTNRGDWEIIWARIDSIEYDDRRIIGHI